jgi:hypothetical protein
VLLTDANPKTLINVPAIHSRIFSDFLILSGSLILILELLLEDLLRGLKLLGLLLEDLLRGLKLLGLLLE